MRRSRPQAPRASSLSPHCSSTEGDRLRIEDGAAYTLTQEGADAVVTLNGLARVILVGVQTTSLTGDWILAA
jgi:hypothetical protein